MPIYEYQCEACRHELEVLQKINDEPLRECPVCHELRLKKKVSAAAFRLKGGGWYETDFKTGDKKNIAGDDKKAAAKDDGGAAKIDSPAKPAADSGAGSKPSGTAASSD